MEKSQKITFGCYPSFVSLYLVNILIVKYGIRFEKIIISTKKIRINGVTISGLKGLMYMIKNFGFKFTFYQIFLSGIYPFFLFVFKKRKTFLSFKKLSKIHNIPIIYSSNFNSTKLVENISNYDNEVFLSMGLDQILKEKFINSFQSCVNIHPSKLPDFKGPDSIFNFLLSSEKEMGVTIHQIAIEIDSGDIILTSKIKRKKGDTHLSLLKEAVVVGADIFNNYIRYIDKIQPIAQKEFDIIYEYKSWPDKSDLINFTTKEKYCKFKDLYL